MLLTTIILMDHAVCSMEDPCRPDERTSQPTSQSSLAWRDGVTLRSPDGNQFAQYRQLDPAGGQETIILNGRRGPAFHRITPFSLFFLPDGNHLVYIALQDGLACLIIDQHVVARWDAILRFPRTEHMVVSGQSPLLDGPNQFHYIAKQRENYCRVSVTIIDGATP